MLLTAREWIFGAGEHVIAFDLAKAVGKYSYSQRAATTVHNCFQVGPGGTGSEPAVGFTS